MAHLLPVAWTGDSYFLLLPSTVSLKVLATEKPTFLRAGILIGSPVCGLRPMRAFILRRRKIPRPGILTDSPFFTVLTTVSIIDTRTSSICFRLALVPSASFATNCAFVISTSWGVGEAARTYGTPRAGVKETHVYQGLRARAPVRGVCARAVAARPPSRPRCAGSAGSPDARACRPRGAATAAPPPSPAGRHVPACGDDSSPSNARSPTPLPAALGHLPLCPRWCGAGSCSGAAAAHG